MARNLTQKIFDRHVRQGSVAPGQEVSLKIDQTLTQDATGTMAYLQWEAIGLDRVRTELSVSYVDHNTLQMGFRNPDDHRYLRTAAAQYGIVFSPAGTGICHQLHLENFACPGKTLLGSDSHTPTAGGVGSLAIGAGGLSVALAMAGEPYVLNMPKTIGAYLQGELQGWATAKDVILHILRELSVKGGVGAVMEYCGPGVENLSVPERATITNMGAELGATSSIFPSDEQTRFFLRAMGREKDFRSLQADPGAKYDEMLHIDLDRIEPLAAAPHMPDNVVAINDLAGTAVDQVAIGSCTNSSYADLKLAAQILAGQKVDPDTDVLLSPGSRSVVKMLAQDGSLETFLDAGVRILECACGPCIGMGGSPVSGGVSLRTFNRNFEGRSGTKDAQVYLVSPVAASHAALRGKITSVNQWGDPLPKPDLPRKVPDSRNFFLFPPKEAPKVKVERGPNIVALDNFARMPEAFKAPVLLKVGDNITTDHILPAGAHITALRSNIPEISKYVFSGLDPGFYDRAIKAGQGIILGGENYGQGSSREHAALAPRHLGILAVIAKSFARIHRSNLVNFGILPLIFSRKEDYDALLAGMELNVPCSELEPGNELTVEIPGSSQSVKLSNDLRPEELDVIRCGGLLNYVRLRRTEAKQ